jgi:hypothetical protein
VEGVGGDGAGGRHPVKPSLDALRNSCPGLSSGQSPSRRDGGVAIEFIANESQCITKDNVEIVGASRFDDFIAHRTKGLKEQLSDVGEDRRVANRDAVLPREGKEFTEGMVDGLRGAEVVQRTEEFHGRFFGVTKLAILKGMLGTEGLVALEPSLAATAAVRGEELALASG